MRYLALVLVTVACADPPAVGRFGDRCDSNADCTAGPELICIDDRCRDASTDLQITFEVQPPPGLSLERRVVRQQFPAPVGTSRRTYVLALTEATAVSFVAGQQVDVDVFRQGPMLPGRSFIQSLRVFPPGAGGSTFSVIRLLPGRYDFDIRPAVGLPPVEVIGEQISRDTTSVPLPTSDFLRIEGTVVQSTQQDRPIADVRVLARGVSSGRTSIVGTTDDEGFYSILLPQFDDTEFDVFAIPGPSAQPAWTYRERITAPFDDIRDFVLPLELPAEEERRCSEICVFGGSVRVPRARVELEAIDTRNETIAFRASGTGGQDGCLDQLQLGPNDSLVPTSSVALMSGRYRVIVRPPVSRKPGDPPFDLSLYRGLDQSDPVPDGLPYAVTETELEVPRTDSPVPPGRDPCAGEALEALQLEVEPRKLVIGRIVGERRSIRNPPFLTFTPLDREDLPPVVTRPDSSGRFALFLEPGVDQPARYLWTATPAGGDRNRLPVAFGEVAITPTEGTALLTQRITRALVIPESVGISGRVVRFDGAPLEAARVRIFTSLPEADRAIPLAEARTGPDGAFVARLPARSSGP